MKNSKSDEAGLRDRLEALDDRLDELQEEKQTSRKHADKSDRSGFAKALKMSSEFIAAVIVGAGLGYIIDRYFGSAPWGMIVLLLLGFAAGIVNLMRASGQMSDPFKKSTGFEKNKTANKGEEKSSDDLWDDDEWDWGEKS